MGSVLSLEFSINMVINIIMTVFCGSFSGLCVFILRIHIYWEHVSQSLAITKEGKRMKNFLARLPREVEDHILVGISSGSLSCTTVQQSTGHMVKFVTPVC